MNCIDIDSSQHELYDSWRKLYTVSFPIFEQRTQEQQEKAFSCADYHLVGYSEGDYADVEPFKKIAKWI